MKSKQLALAGVAAAGAVVAGMGSSPASADNFPWVNRTTEGGSANCRMWTANAGIHDNQGWIECNLTDSWDDGDAIYVPWKVDGFANRYMYAPNRVGNSHGVDGVQVNDPIGTLRWQVCKDVIFNDPCSGTQEFRTDGK